MNSAKLLFFTVSIAFISCKKEITSNKSNPNLEIITNEIVSDSITTKTEEIKIDSEKLTNSHQLKKVIDLQKDKTNRNSTARIDEVEEAVNKTVNVVEDHEEIEILKSSGTDQKEKVTRTIVKKEILPKQKPVLKAEIEYIDAVEFKEKIKDKNVQLIDVRTPKEFMNERINGAININYYKKELFKNEMEKLDRSKPIYIYCRSGVRSSRSAKILKNAGFKVYDLKEGILDWKRNNFKTVK